MEEGEEDMEGVEYGDEEAAGTEPNQGGDEEATDIREEELIEAMEPSLRVATGQAEVTEADDEDADH